MGLQVRPAVAILALEQDEARADKKAKSMKNGLSTEFGTLKAS